MIAMRRWIALPSLLLAASALDATAQVQQVDSGTVNTDVSIDFPALFPDAQTAANVPGVLNIDSAQVGERFQGQVLGTTQGSFDSLSGTPGNNLPVARGANFRNLVVVFLPLNNDSICGIGPHNGSSGEIPGDSIGRGSIAVKFNADQSELSVALVKNAGPYQLKFYRRDGSLINTISNSGAGARLGFRSATAEIAGFTAENTTTSPFGLCINDLAFTRNGGSGGGSADRLFNDHFEN